MSRLVGFSVKKLIGTVTALFLVFIVVIFVNQAAQLVGLAASVSPIVGKILLFFFLLLAVFIIIGSVLMLIRLEKPLAIPDVADADAYAQYLVKLRKRLEKNSYLKSIGYAWNSKLTDAQSIGQALDVLDKRSQGIIKASGSSVFITTAISQNGSLDSLFVLISAIKLVWQLSMLYSQRPALGNLTKLYVNVFSTVLLARQINDIDLLSEQLQPILTSLVGGSMGTAVPGISYIASYVVDSILEGGLNTLLMLRVGLIAQNYCRSIVKTEPRTIGRTATVAACAMLGSIVFENSKRITDAVFRALKKAAVEPVMQGKKKLTDFFTRPRPGETT